MLFQDFLSEYSLFTLAALALFAFLAGFIDAVVGGGGLIQLPAMLINLPHTPLVTLFGTNKFAAFAGTSAAAVQYARKVKFDLRLLLVVAAFAFLAAFLGARAVMLVDANRLKPLILIILIVIAVYTFIKKDLGTFQSKHLTWPKQLIYGSLIGLSVGFYDGFFGPGTGSFLVLGFVVILGFEFITASAYAKIINAMTNISALIVFIRNGHIIFGIGILMAISNVTGSILGSRMSLKRGNAFVRIFFLIIVSLMILRYAWDLIMKS
jgi:uncharacterized protein